MTKQLKYSSVVSPSTDVFDEWFQTERGTELEEDDIPDFDVMTDDDE